MKLLPLIAALLLAGCASLEPVAPAPQAPAPAPDPVAAPAPPVVVPETPAPDTEPPPPKPLVKDDLQPEQPVVDFKAPAQHADLWARLRAGMQLADLDGERVQKWERWYASRPDYVGRMTERGGRYLFHIVQEVEKRGMPMELALLPFIESAFNPEAMSRVKASGMWQFMSATGKDFDLKQNLFRDDRRDVLASTRAALDYLAQLGRRYNGDWQLALAAYNWGMGNVDRAVKRAKAEGKVGGYLDLRMPTETADYVPKLQAVKNIVMRPAEFALQLPALANHPYFLSVEIERDIDVDLAARLAGLTPDVFRQFNPQMNKPVILAAATPTLLLPYENAERFAGNLAEHRGPLASWTALQVKKTLKPAEAAKLAGMSEAELREVNRIPGRMLIKAGSTLLVPRSAKHEHDVSEHLADTAALALTPEQRLARRTVKARKGDTLASVAKRHGVSAQQIAGWNPGRGLNAKLQAGENVTLMQPVRAKSAVAKGKAKKKPVLTAKKKPVRVAARAASKPLR